MSILDINNTPLTFRLKRSILNFLVFRTQGSGFQLSPLDQELILEKNYHGFLKF